MCLKGQSSTDRVGKEFGVSGRLREGACGSIMESERQSGAEEAGEVSRGCSYGQAGCIGHSPAA